MKFLNGLCALGLALTFGTGHAALVDRGNGLVYDTEQNLTWLQDANLAASQSFSVVGINADGTMNWNTATQWIAAMNASGYLGQNSWRLPTTILPDGPCGGSFLGGFEYNCSGIEMGHLFYKSLGNMAPYSPAGVFQPDYGVKNAGPFLHLEGKSYWSSTEWSANTAVAYRFDFSSGGLDETDKTFSFPTAWAVIDGEIATPVPEPTESVLLLFGLCVVLRFVRARCRD
jgi:hypothetical protein